MAIVRWDPFGEMTRMQRDMDRIFSRFGQSSQGGDVAWMPKIDVKRSGDDVMVRAELPGMKPEDVDIELSENMLTISGERKYEEEKEDEDEGWLVRESSYGSFERSLSIPESVDPGSITANFNDGILEVRIPRALEKSQPQRTKIQIGQQTQMQMGAGQQGMQGQEQMQQGQTQGMSEEDAKRQQEESQRTPAGVGGRDTDEGWL